MIQLKNLFQFQFIALFMIVHGKVEFVMQGVIEHCGDDSVFDMSELEFSPFNDTHTFLNGTVTILQEIRSPWTATGVLERFENGKYQQSFLNRKIAEFCSVMQNPIEPWYLITKNFKKELKCPIAAGTKLNFINQPLNDFNIEFPPNLVGKWRTTLRSEISTGLLKPPTHECHRVSFDAVET